MIFVGVGRVCKRNNEINPPIHNKNSKTEWANLAWRLSLDSDRASLCGQEPLRGEISSGLPPHGTLADPQSLVTKASEASWSYSCDSKFSFDRVQILTPDFSGRRPPPHPTPPPPPLLPPPPLKCRGLLVQVPLQWPI